MVAAKNLSSSSSAAAKTQPSSVSEKDQVCNGQELVGSRVKVWWPIDRAYYTGVIDSYNSRSKKHRVSYDDGEKEILDMSKEKWELMEVHDEEKSGNESSDATPEPVNRKSPSTNGKMGDIGGKIVAAASRMRSINKISEATNGKKKRASSSSSEAVSEKVRPSSKKSKMEMTDDDEHTSDDDESKPLRILVDKLKGKKKKTKQEKEKEAPKEETEEGE